MASSSQRHGKQKGKKGKFATMDVYVIGWHIRATAALGDLRLDGMVDTGSSHILVLREIFDNYITATNDEYLKNIPDDKDKKIYMRFPSMPVTDVNGHLYKATISLGSKKEVRVKDQAFYVVDDMFDECVIGLGPPNSMHLIDHTLEEAPSFLHNAVSQMRLDGPIYGFNLSSWIKPGGTDEIDIGGIDKNSFTGTMHYTERCRGPDLDTWYSLRAQTITYGEGANGSVTIAKNPTIGIVDSGVSAILLSEDMYVNGYYKSILDRKIDCTSLDEGSEFPWIITISAESVEKLETLIFEFKDMQDGKPFLIKIPPEGQVFPPSIGTYLGVPSDRRALAVGMFNDEDHYDFMLGIPCFQQYYIVTDLAHKSNRVGFAKKTKAAKPSEPAGSSKARKVGEGSYSQTKHGKSTHSHHKKHR